LLPGGQRLPVGLDDAGDVCPAGQEQADALPGGHGPVSEPLKSLLAVSGTCSPITCSIWTRSRTVSMAAMVVMLLSSW